MNAVERTQLKRILKYSDDLFYGTLGDWDTEPFELELKPDYKPLNCKYYPIPRINKENFCKELKCLAKIGVLTPVQQSQHGTPVFIITKKEGNMRCIT